MEAKKNISAIRLWVVFLKGVIYALIHGGAIYYFLHYRIGLDHTIILRISLAVGFAVLSLYIYLIWRLIQREKTIG